MTNYPKEYHLENDFHIALVDIERLKKWVDGSDDRTELINISTTLERLERKAYKKYFSNTLKKNLEPIFDKYIEAQKLTQDFINREILGGVE